MRLIDWRDADPALLAGIWRDQIGRWNDDLAWDSAPNWTAVETQRRARLLPGLILLDDNRVYGWTFFLVHRETLQIGAFETDSPESTRILLDAVLMTATPAIAPAGAMLFAFSAAPDLVPALAARGFETEPYRYLVRDVAGAPDSASELTWNPGAALDLPSLLSRAYAEPRLTRPFARTGTRPEWEEYAAQLLGSPACGQFEPALSAAHVGHDGALDAAIVTTVVSSGTAHIAQVVVARERRGQGLAAAMVQDVIARAKRAGLERVSLLVGEDNVAAMRVYTNAGFRETASFISAGRGPRVADLKVGSYASGPTAT